MKIAYYAKPNPRSDDTELHIKRAFEELGHEVEMGGVEGDFVLFHKQIPSTTSKKVCWYFDKIKWREREEYIKEVLKKADYVFVTDETWAKENPHPKLRILRQGVGSPHKGLKVATTAKIVFTGELYGQRMDWAGAIGKRYGDDFQVYRNVFNDDLNNLCVSVPIFVAPKEPSDDYYWSSRVYITVGSGGFLIHPRLKGLEAEYTDDEMAMYDTEEEMYEKIDYYLANPKEREKIRLKGWKKTKDNYTYKHRVCSLIATLQQEQSGSGC